MCQLRLLVIQKLKMARTKRTAMKRKASKKAEEPPPERPQQDENRPEPNRRRVPRKPEEAPPERPQQDENQPEPNVGNEPGAQQTQEPAIQGVYTPRELQEQHPFCVEPFKPEDDVIAFLLNWMMIFIYIFFFTFATIVVSVHGFLSYNYDETLWSGSFFLSLIFFCMTASAILPLSIEINEFQEYILKCAGILNFFVILAFTVVVFCRSYFVHIEFDETFWKIATWISILWLICVTSALSAWFTIHNRHHLKKKLLDFLLFTIRYTFAFIFQLFLLMFIVFACGNKVLGIEFDDTFWKVVGCLCYILAIVIISGFIALIHERCRWKQYDLRLRNWRRFLVVVFAADT